MKASTAKLRRACRLKKRHRSAEDAARVAGELGKAWYKCLVCPWWHTATGSYGTLNPLEHKDLNRQLEANCAAKIARLRGAR